MFVRLVRHFFMTSLVLLASIVIDSDVSAANTVNPVRVNVGAYEYGVVYFFEDGKPRGMVPKLIKLLNDIQADYHFHLVETSSRRRFQDLEEGKIDLVMFENPLWGWQDFDVNYSDKIITTEDLYIRRHDAPPRRKPFENIYLSSIICVLGFHYGFADFNADPEHLAELFDIHLAYNETEVLNGVVRGDAEIGIISTGFLARKFVEDPSLREKIEVGRDPDAIHDLVSVISPQSPISVTALNRLMEQLILEGDVHRIWQDLNQGLSG